MVPTTIWAPLGLDWNVSVDVRGCSVTLVVVASPRESVAVSRSSSVAGRSWSGAAKEPPATPMKSCSAWVWQSDGQWFRSSDQDRAEAGIAPSSGSVAEPEKVMTWPTLHCRLAAGVVIVGVGARSFTITTTEATADSPWGLVTFSRTVRAPACV